MNTKELQGITKTELHKLLAEKRDQVRELRFKVHEGQLKTVDKIKKIKKDIARILTLINK